MTKLVIVESPTKIKKVQEYLPDGFIVESCVGHIRDLPSKKAEVPAAIKDKEWADYGIDYTNGFQPHYITIRGKGKVITELKRRLKDADELLLATDEDREGESISWHLIEALKPKVPVKRMVFNEITKKAVLAAVESPRELDMNLVQAQETRRILDRLYGYALSPLLWKKIGGSLSAGRVQSVATRLVVSRERERRAFRKGSYWDLTAHLDNGGEFGARLQTVAGKRIATGKDFDKDTGKIAEGKDVLLLEEAEARQLQDKLQSARWKVDGVTHTPRTSSPPAPFITSTLQQDANNRLGYGAKRTMDIAQRLYQEGFITYMRTDSTALSEEGQEAAKAAIIAAFGDQHYGGPRDHQSKKSKGAQEAHEAIRPAGADWPNPDYVKLGGDEKKLYQLIWQRTVASQMADEKFTSTRVELTSEEAVFIANGKRVDFAGYRAAYPVTGDDERELPPMEVGDVPICQSVDANGRETRPPARYTEASLVKALEDHAIGRPSTYASILDTIQRRGYVILKGKALVPSFTAFAVVGLLEKHFPTLVDTTFTAAMEKTLDNIAAGESDWVPFLDKFFLGADGLKAQVDQKLESVDAQEAKIVELGDLPFTVKVGRYGAYVEQEIDGEEVHASIPEETTPDELTAEMVAELIRLRAEGPDSLGNDPETGKPIFIMTGRFGPYYQLGDGEDEEKPKRASLPRGKKMSEASLEEGSFLLSLPKTLGQHPDGGDVAVGQGRFGPYIMLSKPDAPKPEYRSLKAPDTMQDMTFERAVELLSQPKGGRRGPTVIKELGEHPKEGGPVQILDGRYGPYVKHDKTNATVPKEMDPNKVTMEQAIDLIEARRARQG